MLIDKETIQNYIPQQAPFTMVDALVSATPEGFQSEYTIPQEHPLLNDDFSLSESAMVENVAQTCAAGFGFLNHREGGEPKLGFIGAVSRLETFGLPKVNDKLETKVEVLSAFEAINLVEGRVFHKGDELLRCQLKIVIA